MIPHKLFPAACRAAAAPRIPRSSGLAVLLAAGVVLAGCGSAGGSATSSLPGKGEPITIGVSVSLTGDFSSDGQPTEQGYKTWAAFQNAHGGLLGHPIKLDILSDGSSPTQVATNYQKLISQDHVDFVVGPFSTLLTREAAIIAARYSYTMVEAEGGSPAEFQSGRHNAFDASASASDQMKTFAQWVVATQHPQPVAFATLDDPFVSAMVDGARTYLAAHGFHAVVNTVYPAETADYSPIAAAIEHSGAKIAVLGTQPPDGYALIQSFIQGGYNPTALIEAGGPDQGTAFVKAVGAKNTEGIMVPNTWYPGSNGYQNSAMVNLYLKMFGGTRDTMSADVAEAFSAGQVLTQAVDHIRSVSNSKLKSYLLSGVTFQTVQGPAKFGSDGENVAAQPYVFQWQHGQLVPVLPAGPGASPIEAVKPAWGATKG